MELRAPTAHTPEEASTLLGATAAVHGVYEDSNDTALNDGDLDALARIFEVLAQWDCEERSAHKIDPTQGQPQKGGVEAAKDLSERAV